MAMWKIFAKLTDPYIGSVQRPMDWGDSRGFKTHCVIHKSNGCATNHKMKWKEEEKEENKNRKKRKEEFLFVRD